MRGILGFVLFGLGSAEQIGCYHKVICMLKIVDCYFQDSVGANTHIEVDWRTNRFVSRNMHSASIQNFGTWMCSL